jgi:hypothetical protein
MVRTRSAANMKARLVSPDRLAHSLESCVPRDGALRKDAYDARARESEQLCNCGRSAGVSVHARTGLIRLCSAQLKSNSRENRTRARLGCGGPSFWRRSPAKTDEGVRNCSRKCNQGRKPRETGRYRQGLEIRWIVRRGTRRYPLFWIHVAARQAVELVVNDGGQPRGRSGRRRSRRGGARLCRP